MAGVVCRRGALWGEDDHNENVKPVQSGPKGASTLFYSVACDAGSGLRCSLVELLMQDFIPLAENLFVANFDVPLGIFNIFHKKEETGILGSTRRFRRIGHRSLEPAAVYHALGLNGCSPLSNCIEVV